MKKDWIIILSGKNNDESYIDVTVNKEQNNGLEAIGDIVKEGDESSPMDSENKDTDDAVNKKPKSDSTDDKKTDDDTDPSKTDTSNKDDDEKPEPTTTDATEEPDSIDSTDTDTDDSTSDSVSNTDSTSNTDSGTGVSPDPTLLDPHFIQNRRILLSNKLLKLYDAVKDSMNVIANGPAFENKPVMLEELGRLCTNVSNINEGINKADHKVLLLRYAVCVKTYNKIIEM